MFGGSSGEGGGGGVWLSINPIVGDKRMNRKLRGRYVI